MKISNLISDYKSKYPKYKEFSAKLSPLFNKILRENYINCLQVSMRIKSLPSYLDKAYKISTDNHSPIKITDLLGVRLVAYYYEDIFTLARLIEDKFIVHHKNSEYEYRNKPVDKFNYASLHYKISLGRDIAKANELQEFDNIIFEIQVRTIAQHAWSAVDHKIRYKIAEELPHDIKRQIYQLSALYEIADNQFSNIKEKITKKNRSSLEKLKSGDLSAKINVNTIKYYLTSNQKIIHELISQAKNIGFRKTVIENESNFILYLLKLLKRVNIYTIEELDKLFQKSKQDGEKIMQSIYNNLTEREPFSLEHPFPVVYFIFMTIRLKSIRFNQLNISEIVYKIFNSSVQSLSSWINS